MSRRRGVGPGDGAWVVGGSMGIGLACARAFAARGAHVALFARREGPLLEAARRVAEARRDPDQRVVARTLDAADPEAAARILGETLGALGPPDLLLNCAGRARPARFEDVPPEQLGESFRANVHTAWNAIQALLPAMRGGGGTIVNTASLAGLIGTFGYTDYAASKFALVGFSEALRCELRPQGVRVAVLCPPDTDTPGFAEEEPGKPPETRAVSAAASLLQADDVARALLTGLERGRFLIVPGRSARLLAFGARHWPALARFVMDRDVRRARTAPSGTGGP